MSYTISFNEPKKEILVTTPPCLIDNVHLLTKYQHPDYPDNKPKYSVRAIMDAQKSLNFRMAIAKECRKILNGKTQFHPLIAPKDTPEKFLCNDFIKIGAEVIAQKKAIDELQDDPRAKKAYSPIYDYLEPLVYFFTRSEFEIPVFDEYGKKMSIDSDGFFLPSFKGVLKIGIKWCKADKNNPLNGGHLYSYLMGVQFIGKTNINLMRGEVKFEAAKRNSDCMFDIPEKEKDNEECMFDDTPIARAKRTTGAVSAKKQKEVNDDIADYVEQY